MTEIDLWDGRPFAVIDVEGNGQRPPDLVELGVVPVEAGTVGETVSWLVRPIEPITGFARRIHGISNDDVADKPAFDEIGDVVGKALGDAVPVGHNVRIDLDVMGRKMPQWSPAVAIDTLRMARKAWPDQKTHKLTALVEHFGLDKEMPSGLRPHRVDFDVLVTAKLFLKLIEDLRITTWDQLLDAGGIHLAPASIPEPDAEPRLF
ncbi:3'-5' exonuclease [Saccharopolyspora sp. NPDC000359]|uniref:3'-5' exonuclease n=1 Tax=Saccharopolyspora sp. NPDC000359 TaxID=3154251 RepID=UPI003329EDD7